MTKGVKPKDMTLEEWRLRHGKSLTFRRGESYVLEFIYFGDGRLKIEMDDPRDLNLLDKNRIHAKIMEPHEVSDLKMWLAINFL